MMFPLDSPRVELFLTQWFHKEWRFQWGQYRHYHDPRGLEEYVKFIKNCLLAGRPAFHSVSPCLRLHRIFWEFDITKEELEEKGIDITKVKFTYDSPLLDDMWFQVLKLATRIVERGGKPLIVYSGNKGFHVWVYSRDEPFVFFPDGERKAKALYKAILHDVMGDERDYPNWDRAPTSLNSMARIPFSFHQRSYNQVIPLTTSREPYIPDVQHFLKYPLDRAYILEIFKKVDEDFNWRATKPKLHRRMEEYPNWGIRPCILEKMDKNPDHNVRLAFLMDALYAGMTDEQIHDSFRKLEDYDYDKTQYQIEHSRGSMEDGVRPFSNETLKRMGIKRDEPWT